MKTWIVSLLFLVLVLPSAMAQQEPLFKDTYYLGEVQHSSEPASSEVIGDDSLTQQVEVSIDDHEDPVSLDHVFTSTERDARELHEGDQVVVLQNREFDEVLYYLADQYRLPMLGVLLLIFFALIVFFTGWKGLTSMIGLVFNIFVIVGFILPQILAGASPLLVCFGGGVVILLVSLYCAHGFNQRTTLAMASTLIALVLALLMSMLFVSVAKLSGLGTEEAFFLQLGEYGRISLRGLLLGGMVIGALGVLDDVTTAQAAVVDELKKANPRFGFADLYQRGLSIGREHITSLVNTLALAYAGASLPTLLIFSISQQPAWVVLNSEMIAEELVRTLVGSVALVLAVPITTALSAWWWSRHPGRA